MRAHGSPRAHGAPERLLGYPLAMGGWSDTRNVSDRDVPGPLFAVYQHQTKKILSQKIHTTSNGFSQKKFVLKTKRAEGNDNNNFRAGGSGGSEKQISSISWLWVAGLKLRRPTKHVLWEQSNFSGFSRFFAFFAFFEKS